jgi:ubiquinone/menaquinone biosynthesis C-methylase UbiE
MTLQKDPEGKETFYLNQSAVFTDKRVLEIGSGDGRLTWRYAHSTGRVTGIDMDADALRVAATDRPANLYETVSFVRASSLDLPVPRGTFDIAILAWSF